MSYVLVRQGQPPSVLTPENAEAYFEISAALRDTARHGPATRFRLPALVARFSGLLAEDADRRHPSPERPPTAGVESVPRPWFHGLVMTDYDLIVIGSGPAGRHAAIQGAKLGRRVAIVERQQGLGGCA